jgi:hypothetical protein
MCLQTTIFKYRNKSFQFLHPLDAKKTKPSYHLSSLNTNNSILPIYILKNKKFA